MVAMLLSKGEAKDVAIKAGAAMMDAAMMTAAMMAAAMMATALTNAAMTVPRAATGAMTNKAAQIIKGVAAAMIATTTGGAVVHTRLTMLRTRMINHAAPLARALLSAPEAVRTPGTLPDPANLASLMNLKVHTYRHITWRKPCPRR